LKFSQYRIDIIVAGSILPSSQAGGMSMTRFLFNDQLWNELQRCSYAKNVCAAVAFIGIGGADLLPLKRGDTLVVNLSLTAVKQESTDPREIKKFMERGISVFTRSCLHAKMIITNNTLIAGSANISNHSRQSLDEAGIITTDTATVRQARAYFAQLCTEHVRQEYLNECLNAYQPPRIASKAMRKKGAKRITNAKLWLIGDIREYEVPALEAKRAAAIVEKTKKQLRNPADTYVALIHYPARPAFFNRLRKWDWTITCFTDKDKRKTIWAPAQVIELRAYPRSNGKTRSVLLLEAAKNEESMPLSRFRQRIKNLVPVLDRESPRTTPILSDEAADEILRWWTPKGKLAKRTAT
jgi:hypothetical protein